MNTPLKTAPPLNVIDWLNTDTPITLDGLRGKVVVIEAFQMLCPGCVSHSLPQAMKVSQIFSSQDVAVIGLHTVFEHHAAQGTRTALEAFIHEYRLTFPIGIDAPSNNGDIPKTMSTYRMRGTPTLILIDRQGRLRKSSFGGVDDLALGAEIMALVMENEPSSLPADNDDDQATVGCDDNGCALPQQ